MLLTPLTVAGFLSLAIYRYIIVPVFLSPLSTIPTAHLFCAFTDKWLRWQQKHQNESKSLYAAHQKHGPIVRIGPQEISVNSQDGLRSIYTAGFEKTNFYDGRFQNYGTLNLVSTLDHRTHSVRKRMISSVHAKSYVQRSTDVATLSTRIVFERFLPLLRQYANNKDEVNVMDLFQWAGIDFMSAYNFGTARSTDFLWDKAGRDTYFDEWSKFRDEFIGEKTVVEGLGMKMLRDTIESWSSEEAASGTKAVVASLLYSQLSQKVKAEAATSSEDELMRRCASELLDHMIAAHEGLAIALTYVVYRLSLDPALQSALRSELQDLDPPISEQAGEHALPSPDIIDNLSLLNGILLETLRMYAPVPGRQPRVAPAGGMTLHDRFIPAGTTVSCNAYSLHRKEELFPRPCEWLPQRWMAEGDRSAMGAEFPHPSVIRRYMWAFGSGGRMCIGSNFATQVLKLLIASIYTNFATSIIDDEGIEQSDALIAGPESNKLIIEFHDVAL